MKVHQLRAILDHVPDDLDVVIFRSRCGHVHNVRRSANRHETPALQLHGSWPVWACEADDFELHGPFRRRAELLAKLDPDVPEGDPA